MGLQDRLESSFGGDAAIHIFEFPSREALLDLARRLTFLQVDAAGDVSHPKDLLYEETPDPTGVIVLTIAGRLTTDQNYEIRREALATPPQVFKSMAVGPISKGNLDAAIAKLKAETKPWWKFW